MINQELFNKIADEIENDPDSFEMVTWCTSVELCRTVACIAGKAIINSATTLPDFKPGDNPETWLYRVVDGLFPDHSIFTFSAAATELLGIDEETASRLFYQTDYTVSFPTLLRELGKGKSIEDFWPLDV